MSDEINPYNCSLPGNLFTGYEEELRSMVKGLRNGKSYALFGGRRCGKTSLLLKIGEILNSKGLEPYRVLPRMFDMQAVAPRSTFDFFEKVYALATEELETEPLVRRESRFYDAEFLGKMERARPAIEREHGPNWLIVLLIDEIDSGARKLPNSECLENFRNLLMNSPFSRHFRAVATAATGIGNLIREGSPLNNLDPNFLGILAQPAARGLIAAGLNLPAPLEARVLELTGRHPYLMQALLENLWDEKTDGIDDNTVVRATHRMVKDRRGTFSRWLDDFESGACAAFQVLAERGTASKQEIRQRMPTGKPVAEALEILSYHGVVEEIGIDRYGVTSTVFRDWFKENHQLETSAGPTPAPPSQDRSKRVFMVYGRNEKLRVAMVQFLRAIGLEPLEWTDIVEATGDSSPFVGQVLEQGFSMAQAAVVLLTPDEEARLRDEFHSEHDPESEKVLGTQPRPNVLIEAGMALAKFPKSTVLVQFGAIRGISDLLGRMYIRMDNTDGKREELARRLLKAGCAVNLDNTRWLKAGDFSLNPAIRSAKSC